MPGPIGTRFRDSAVGPMPSGLVERNWRGLFALGTAALDAVALVAAFLMGRSLAASGWWRGEAFPAPQGHVQLVLLAYLGFGALIGLYRNPYAAPYPSQLWAMAKAYAWGTAVMLGLAVWSDDQGFPARAAAQVAIVVPVAWLAARVLSALVREALQAAGWALDRTVLIMTDGDAAPLSERLGRLRSLGYDAAATVHEDPAVEPTRFLDEVDRAVVATGARCLLLFNVSLAVSRYTDLLDYAQANGLKLRMVSTAADEILRRTRVHDLAGITMEAPARFKLSRVKGAAKRVFDLVIGSCLLVLVAPVLLVVAVAIKLESQGPLFYRQARSASKRSPHFRMYKFRSMRSDSDGLRASLLEKNDASGALFKLRNDPRITRVGRLIRKLSLDELPQLLNVLRGEMSLVGPRPLPVEDYDQLTEQETMGGHYERRTLVKPGITGLWQISGRSDIGFREMVLLDLYYVENHSILFDLEILMETVPVVLFGRGAY